ncbi:hypothetical protein [Acuticoccus sp.]|uniref:hypothetical protein n=1 Tax=Acuticoccus sp. TaxID=1904378 RepID=UPI003B52FF42
MIRTTSTTTVFLAAVLVAGAATAETIDKTVNLARGSCNTALSVLLDELTIAAEAACPSGTSVAPLEAGNAQGLELLGCRYAGEPLMSEVTATARLHYECR